MYKVKVAVSKDGKFLRHDWMNIEADSLDEARRKVREIESSAHYAMDLTAVPDLRTIRRVCPVCECGKLQFDETHHSHAAFLFVEGRAVLCVGHIDFSGRCRDATSTIVNYCPFCGRKLMK